jgi:hypothetical protein
MEYPAATGPKREHEGDRVTLPGPLTVPRRVPYYWIFRTIQKGVYSAHPDIAILENNVFPTITHEAYLT